MTITLLHVIDLNLHSPLGEVCKADCWKDAVRKLDETMRAMADEQVEAEALILEGRPAAVIGEAARQFDLIVIGKRNTGSFWRLFSRRAVERVLNQAPCPVLIVGERRTQVALHQHPLHEVPAGTI